MSLRPRTLRGRLAVVLAIVTVLVSGAVAFFVLVRYKHDISRQVNESLETRYADVTSAVQRAPASLPDTDLPIIPKAEVFAQVLTPDGRILAASPRALLDRPVLDARQLATAARERVSVERAVPPRAADARLLAGPQMLGPQQVVVVVGAPLDEHQRSEERLALALAIGFPILAAILIGAGWFIVGAALRPMEELVSEADDLSARGRGGRLSVQGPTEVADLATHLNEMLARIEAALDHERAFLDDASHELRTPIAIVRGEIELARPLAEEDSEVREALDSALEEVDRLQVLALNLLVLARTRAAGAPPDEPVDLRAVVDHAVEGVGRTRPRAEVDVQVDGAATTTGDRLELERAVVNLLDNAVRSARSRVVVRLERVGEAVTVEVRDDGPGFPEEVVERSRERFVRGPGGGSGLGLAIVDTIAAAHGGVLELEQGAEGGAVARLRLPAGA